MYTQATTLLLKQIEFNSNQHSIATAWVCGFFFFLFFVSVYVLKGMKLNPPGTSQYVLTIRFI